MKIYYMLWAFGEDRAGIVSAIAEKLFHIGCNIEDSSMMRLGSEFGVFLIFTYSKSGLFDKWEKASRELKSEFRLTVGIKSISQRLAHFKRAGRNCYMINVYGMDRPGIVYKVTQCLSRHKFNITDLNTHRTAATKTPGYIMLIEGELPTGQKVTRLEKDLNKISSSLRTKIHIRPLNSKVI
ncbi:MAG: hypothetical protein LHV69_02600 [Elusimicrobia bacterium]|nr:hypothetical protein [Candidatus Obscuribacterium magneticum]